MKRAYSVRDIMTKKFKTLNFSGEWMEAVGRPEQSGSWMIYGDAKQGKTTFAMQLAKYLTRFGRVAYYSAEEGLVKSIQNQYTRANMFDVAGKIFLLERESLQELTARLQKRRSYDFVIVDSVQLSGLRFNDYVLLKDMFPRKIFIYISHVIKGDLDGKAAIQIKRDATVVIRVKGFKAFTTSRYGGGKPIIISEEKANEYWGLNN